jgi:ferredoxin
VFNPPINAKQSLEKTKARLAGIIADIQARKAKAVKPSNRIGNATKYFSKNGFKTIDACDKCGICVKICPAGNIAIGKDIVFDTRCEICYACVNLCPRHAIYANKAMLKRRSYRNPDNRKGLNDNINAIGFYQKRGFDMVGLNLGAIDRERASFKPEIPYIGQNGIPLRHEIVRPLLLEPICGFSSVS